MKIAIIPARGGSKRIPRKNIKLFHGKPMIAYSIEAALKSGCFDKVIVSTDDHEIAEVAKQYGAEVPFMRPENIADDHSTIRDVLQYEIKKLSLNANDRVCLIYATAPFLNSINLIKSEEKLNSSYSDFVLSVGLYSPPLEKALSLDKYGFISIEDKFKLNSRTQDLKDFYYDAAQFCWGTTSNFLSDKLVLNSNTIPYVIDRYEVIDIDTTEDWEFATKLFEIRNERK